MISPEIHFSDDYTSLHGRWNYCQLHTKWTQLSMNFKASSNQRKFKCLVSLKRCHCRSSLDLECHRRVLERWYSDTYVVKTYLWRIPTPGPGKTHMKLWLHHWKLYVLTLCLCRNRTRFLILNMGCTIYHTWKNKHYLSVSPKAQRVWRKLVNAVGRILLQNQFHQQLITWFQQKNIINHIISFIK